jgi:NTP pyrophosphatase (non-canonical NTP hydrolase)
MDNHVEEQYMNRFADIREWAKARNLIAGATHKDQLTKLMEEVGELAAGIARKDQDKIIDGIGDAIVVLTILAAQSGIRVESCIEAAWQEIKDRKGRMIDGVFVKESDFPRADNAR